MPASRAVLTLFNHPVCVRPTATRVPDILMEAGESMVRHLLREVPGVFEGEDDEIAAERQMARDLASIGFRLADGDAIAERLQRMGWSDLKGDEIIEAVFDYWHLEIEEAEKRAQERWARENGLQPTFADVARARLQAKLGWAVVRSPYDRRGSVLFVEGGEPPLINGAVVRGAIVPLEELEVDLDQVA